MLEPGEDRHSVAPGRGRSLGWLLAVWAFIGLLAMGPTYLHYAAERQPVPWSRLWSEAASWYLWILFFPLILRAARRFPLGRGRWRTNILAHVLAGAVVAALYAVLTLLKNQLVLSWATGDPAPHLLRMLPGFLFGGFQVYFLIYCLLVGAVHAFDYYRKYREREIEAAQLEAQLSRAQLQVLKMQLNPHFLFNTLNAVSVLVYRNPEAADRMIGLLADFLRLTLQGTAEPEIPLAEELELLERYVEIEKVRFGERLRVDIDLDPSLAEARVPPLILQPLVENAVRHGMPPGSGCLSIEVRARAGGRDRIALEVRDDGAGLPAGALREGVGLANTRARLAQLYGAAHRFDLGPGAGRGTIATVVIPLRELGEEEPATGMAPSPAFGGTGASHV